MTFWLRLRWIVPCVSFVLQAALVSVPSLTAQVPPTPTARPVCGNSWCSSSAPQAPRFCPACIALRQQQAAARQAARDAARQAAALRKQQQRARKLSLKAVDASKRAKWADALSLLRQSYVLNPTAETINNIRIATLHTVQNQGSAAQGEDDRSLAQAIANYDQQIAASDAPVAQQLKQFKDAIATASSIQATIGSNSFLVQLRLAAPLPALVTAPLPTVSVNSALEQLSSIEKSSTLAAALASTSAGLNDASLEIAKVLSGCGFDAAPCAAADHLTYPHPVQTPAATALEAQIPPAQRSDPQIQQGLREYDHFESHLAEKQGQIAEVTLSIQAGGADTAALKAYRADLQHQAAQDEQSIAQTVSFLHMHVPTIPAPTAPSALATPAAHP